MKKRSTGSSSIGLRQVVVEQPKKEIELEKVQGIPKDLDREKKFLNSRQKASQKIRISVHNRKVRERRAKKAKEAAAKKKACIQKEMRFLLCL